MGAEAPGPVTTRDPGAPEGFEMPKYSRAIVLATALLGLGACDGGDGETTSNMSSCVPGEAIACGCENGLDGAQSCADDGLSFGACVCEELPADTSTSGGEDTNDGTDSDDSTDGIPDHEPSGWVLRDKDGEVVDAIVEPRCDFDLPFESCSPDGQFNATCVRVYVLDGEPVNMTFDLKTGRWQDCVPPTLEVRLYSDSQCTLPLADAASAPGQLLKWGDSAVRVEDGESAQQDVWSDADGGCEFVGESATRGVQLQADLMLTLPDSPYSF